MSAHNPARSIKCVCGGEMRVLVGGLHRCPLCGRAQWRSDGSGFLVVLIATLTMVALVVLGMIGEWGRNYR